MFHINPLIAILVLIFLIKKKIKKKIEYFVHFIPFHKFGWGPFKIDIAVKLSSVHFWFEIKK